MSGKGSKPRPFSVSQEEYSKNFDAIFGKPDPRVLEDQRNEDEAFKYIENYQKNLVDKKNE